MNLINGIDDYPLQRQSLTLDGGQQLVMTLQFIDQQFGWFFQNITFGDFKINGFRVVTSSNMLHQFKNQIPFGIACFVKDNQEPTLIDDFLTGRASLYLLSSDEVDFFSRFISGTVS